MTQDHPTAKLFCPQHLPEESGAAVECEYLFIFDRGSTEELAWANAVIGAAAEAGADDP
jgi:hypothetical protein